jgi:hypothetical protein
MDIISTAPPPPPRYMYTQVWPSDESLNQLCGPSVSWNWSALFSWTQIISFPTPQSHSLSRINCLYSHACLFIDRQQTLHLWWQYELRSQDCQRTWPTALFVCSLPLDAFPHHISSRETNTNASVTFRLKGAVFLKFSQLLSSARRTFST